MTAIDTSQELQHRTVGSAKVLGEWDAAAAFPSLFETNQPAAFAKSDQGMDMLRHDDEAQAKPFAFRSNLLQKVNDDPFAAILIEQFASVVTENVRKCAVRGSSMTRRRGRGSDAVNRSDSAITYSLKTGLMGGQVRRTWVPQAQEA